MSRNDARRSHPLVVRDLDGGLETTLVFHNGIPLTSFAAFDLMKDDDGTAALRRYFVRYAELARSHCVGVVLESPTWRANPDWGAQLGYDAVALADANRKSIGLLLEIRAAFESGDTPVVISGNLGPRGDGYKPGSRMNVEHFTRHSILDTRSSSLIPHPSSPRPPVRRTAYSQTNAGDAP